MEVDKQRIAELVGKIQSGDNSAFDELYKLTSDRAYFVALEFTKNSQDAEDILQESYIKALSKISELDKPESFSSWLNQIVANKSKDFLKKKKPMLFNSDEEETDATELLPDEDTNFSPEGNLDQTELQKAVMEVLDELSEEKRACVLMMYFEELSVGEIAETLEIPEGTVKTRLFSARKDLKDKFAKRGITSAYSIAPIGIVIWALRRMSDAVSKTFVGSGASAKVLAGITVAEASTAAGVAVAGTTAATTAAAAGTGATATGIVAKIAALTVAQKVIAGVSVAAVVAGGTAGVVTVVNDDDKKDDISTSAYTEEYTTAPSFETTLAIEAMGTVEFSETTEQTSEESTSASSSKLKDSTTKLQNTVDSTTEKAASTSAEQSTTNKQTATQTATLTTESQTTTKVSTTGRTTTRRDYSLYTSATTSATETVTTTEEETTTRPRRTTTTTETVTTTKAVKTTEEPTTTTTTTTEATTMGKATVEIMYFTNGSSASEPTVATVSVDEGSKIDNAFVQNHMKSNFGFSRVLVESGEETDSAVADKTYSFTVHCS